MRLIRWLIELTTRDQLDTIWIDRRSARQYGIRLDMERVRDRKGNLWPGRESL